MEGQEIEKSFEEFNLYESTKDINNEYWIKKFEDFSGPSVIASTRSRKKVFSFTGRSITQNIEDSTCELVNEWCKTASCSPSLLFLLAYIILISKYTNKKDVTIERIVPMYPFSQDKTKYDRLINVLALYRLTLGQPRQEEMISILQREDLSSEQMEELFFDLSPYSRKQKSKE